MILPFSLLLYVTLLLMLIELNIFALPSNASLKWKQHLMDSSNLHPKPYMGMSLGHEYTCMSSLQSHSTYQQETWILLWSIWKILNFASLTASFPCQIWKSSSWPTNLLTIPSTQFIAFLCFDGNNRKIPFWLWRAWLYCHSRQGISLNTPQS